MAPRLNLWSNATNETKVVKELIALEKIAKLSQKSMVLGKFVKYHWKRTTVQQQLLKLTTTQLHHFKTLNHWESYILLSLNSTIYFCCVKQTLTIKKFDVEIMHCCRLKHHHLDNSEELALNISSQTSLDFWCFHINSVQIF